MNEFTVVIRLECNTQEMDYARPESTDVESNNLHPFINRGCYSTDTNIAEIALEELGLGSAPDEAHPMPMCDGIKLASEWTVSAFKDVHQFHAWFPYKQGLRKVKDIARLALYSVRKEHINHGGHQIAVRPTHMELISILFTTASMKEIESACNQEELHHD